MPKSRQVKRIKKVKKRRLVIEYWPGKPMRRHYPQLQTRALIWHGLVTSQLPAGIVDEFTFSPDGPMFLDEFLQVIREEFSKIVADDAVNCGIRVYTKN